MSELILELIAHGPEQEDSYPVSSHVHKYVERVIYAKDVAVSSVPLAYFESDPLDSWRNVQIVDRTYVVPANTLTTIRAREHSWVEIVGASFSSPYKTLAVTDRLSIDERGAKKPLFFRHDTGFDDLSDLRLVVVEDGERIETESGYQEDLVAGTIYTNYRNYHNPDTGAYRLYFVVGSDKVGNTFHQLLNSVPTAKVADYSDIDLDTGLLTTNYPVYSVEKTNSGFTYSFNTTGPWFIRPLEVSVIKPLLPAGRGPEDPWYMRISNGAFSTNVNGAFRNYYLPEFNKQPFAPYKPFIYSTYGKFLWVNENVITSTRENIQIDPSNTMHFSLFIYDADNVLTAALTTDISLEGERVGESEIFYEAEYIQSWDNSTGTVALGLELDPNSTFVARYFYEAGDLEDKFVNLNPLHNKNALDWMWVYYLVPNVDVEDRGLHVLGVDKDGIIRYASQEAGRTYPNFKLFNTDSSINPDTVIGTQYRSMFSSDTWFTTYAAGQDNGNAYYVLAETLVLDTAVIEDVEVIDVRRPGEIITEASFEAAIANNPRILQSQLGYGPEGQEVPQTAAMIIHAPITILEEYGGDLSPERAKELLRTYLPSASYGLIKFDYPRVLISLAMPITTKVTISTTWEGPGLIYNLYRRDNPSGLWVFKSTTTSPATPSSMTFVDSTIESKQVYEYGIRLADSDNEYPLSPILTVKVP
jgi:hypothetical protein